MADHSPQHAAQDMSEHTRTYEGFLTGAVALTLLCLIVMVALVNFRFAHTLNVFSGFAGIILGIILLIVDVRASGKWYLSGAFLVIYGLITAVNIS
jgi:hypothetical protein